jgi:hypothetical protein
MFDRRLDAHAAQPRPDSGSDGGSYRSWRISRLLPVGVVATIALAGGFVSSAGAAQISPQSRLAQRTPAPKLRVSGTTLRWTAVDKIRSYKLATIRHPGTTRDTTYKTVKGTSFKPARVSGQIRYGLRANVPHAPWSTEVTMARRANTKHRVLAKAPPATGKLRIAVMNTTGWGLDSIFTGIGVTNTRLDVGDGSDISLVTKALSDGIKPLVLYNPGSGGGLGGVSPATTASQVVALAQKLLPLGLNEIEFGNEVYYAETAQTYAAQYAAAHAALAGMGVKLLAVATAVQAGAAGNADPTWITDFINALPGGAGEVDAWTIHPYGPMTGVLNGSWGWQTVKDWHAIAVADGSTAPWYITEVGQQLDGTKAVSQATQGADVTQYLNSLSSMPWVVYLDFYTCRDDGSGQFGILNDDNTPRPAFTALQAWMNANASSVNG